MLSAHSIPLHPLLLPLLPTCLLHRRYTYKADMNAPGYTGNVQTYEREGGDAAGHAVSLVRLRVLSNYGHDKFTCIYRFRVHGDAEVAE